MRREREFRATLSAEHRERHFQNAAETHIVIGETVELKRDAID